MRRKHILLLLLILVSCVLVTAPVFAADGSAAQNGEPIEDEGGFFEKAIAAVFDNLYIAFSELTGKFGFKPIGELLLQVEENAYDLSYPAPFTTGQWRKLDALYTNMAGVGLALYLVAILATAGRFISAGVSKNADARAEAVSQVWRLVFAILIIAAAPLAVRVLYVLNNALVEAIANAGKITGDIGKLLSNDWLANLKTGSVIGTAVVKIIFAWAGFWLNIIFWMREVVVSVMYVFTPLMAILWTMNKNVTAAAVWLGELVTNAFLHSAYALAAVVVVVFIAGGDGNWPEKVLAVYMLISLGGVLRNSLQGLWTRWAGIDEEGIAGKALGMFGMGGVAGLGRLASASVAGAAAGGAVAGAAGGAPGGDAPINLQGVPAAGGTAAGTTAGMAGAAAGAATGMASSSSTGAAGVGTISGQAASSPSGWTTSPGGVIIPSGAQTTGAGATSAMPGAGAASTAPGGTQPGAANPLVSSMNYGRLARNVTQGVVHTVGAVGAAVIPGGDRLLRTVSKGAGMAAQVAGTAGGLAYHSYQRAKENSTGTLDTVHNLPGAAVQTLRDGTGTHQAGFGGVAKAAFKAATASVVDTVSPNSTPVVAKKLTGSSLDSYRFK
jgi:hypothetical protein